MTTKVLLKCDPFEQADPDEPFGFRAWPAHWIHLKEAGDCPFVLAYRCRFDAAAQETVRIHVSADERYELFLDGQRIGRGPERGAPQHWFFESYDVDIAPGEHLLVARVWSLGERDQLSPMAQMHVHHGFLLAAEGAWNDRIGTGVGRWEARRLEGYSFVSPREFRLNTPFVGAAERVDAAAFPFGFEHDAQGEGWMPVQTLMPGRSRGFAFGANADQHHLRPAMLPAQLDARRAVGTVRFAETIPLEADVRGLPVRMEAHDAAAAEAWQAMLAGQRSVTVPAGQRMRVLIDLDDYYCAYPEASITGGRGGTVQLHWAEALFEQRDKPDKGNRDEIEAKYFDGFGDQWLPDGGEQRVFRPLWWRAGRYVQVVAGAGETPLTVEGLTFLETRYPFEAESRFDCDEPRLVETFPALIRGMQMCMHETYFDCPYYEQLMYIGDTRLEVLTTYALTHDDRLPRKAIETYDWSRMPDGLTQSRFPCRSAQVIPPFSLWWVCMVGDFAMWRDDPAFVARMMPGVRGVMEAFRHLVNDDGLVESPGGWNFVDWEPQWSRGHAGVPPDGAAGVSGPINWQMVLALEAKAALEQGLGEMALAERDRQAAASLVRQMTQALWSEDRGMFADDRGHQRFSEHSQCLALISGLLSPQQAEAVASGLLSAPDLARTTIYFSYYFFEACRVLGRMDTLFHRLSDWYSLVDQGLKTPIEHPEPTRSDCHAWGAHPLFHLRATVLGIRPAAPGFHAVTIRPQLGPLQRAAGTVPHPQGEIKADLRREGDRIRGMVHVPAAVDATVTVNGEVIRVEDGVCVIE